VTGAVVFDLDGTLIDSLPDIHAAASAMLTEAGARAPTPAATRAAVGHGVGPLVARLAREAGLPPERDAALSEGFMAHYGPAPAALSRPFPNVAATLDALAARGLALAVCTNKPEAISRRILADLGLAGYFSVVVGGDTFPTRKPDPAGLLACLDRLGAGRALYVGDSEVDAETAGAAGVPFVMFTGGYRSKSVEELAPVASFDDFAGLAAIVAART